MTTTTQTPTDTTIASNARPNPKAVLQAIRKRSFATLATTSPRGHAHSAGVLYAVAGTDLWISTMKTSRKARNVASNGSVAVTIPVRRLPVGPPSSILFQARASIIELDDVELRALAADGSLAAITGHGELELAGGCFIKVTPGQHIHTYGIGLSLLSLIRDPLHAQGRVELADLPIRKTDA